MVPLAHFSYVYMEKSILCFQFSVKLLYGFDLKFRKKVTTTQGNLEHRVFFTQKKKKQADNILKIYMMGSLRESLNNIRP